MINARLSGYGGVMMSARELKMVAIKVNHKFASIDDARKVMNSLIEFVRCTCKQKANFCQGIIAISGVKSASINRIVTEIAEKRGRPKLTRIPSSSETIAGVMHG